MKNLCNILLLLLLSIPMLAQDLAAPADTLKSKKQNTSRDRLIFELSYDYWANKPNDISLKWYNRGIGTFVMYDFALYDDNISVAPGVGISSNNYYHDAYISTDTSNNTVLLPIPSTTTSGRDVTYTRNKLSTTYVEIPVEIRFRTNPDKFNKQFKLALGIRAGYCLNAHSKYKGTDFISDGIRDIFRKELDLPNINQYRYGATVRIGYANFNLYGYYSLSTLFDTNKGPGIQPFSVGISFNSF